MKRSDKIGWSFALVLLGCFCVLAAYSYGRFAPDHSYRPKPAPGVSHESRLVDARDQEHRIIDSAFYARVNVEADLHHGVNSEPDFLASISGARHGK